MHMPTTRLCVVFSSIRCIFVFAAVTPNAFINGLDSAEVTDAAGNKVTFTCLARGFPETTLNIQLSGVTASYTIGEQTLMTEATPTSFMEVTRTVTLHNVTVLNCGAVVTCVGSNMNSDGSTHTDQAAATLQVQGEMGWHVQGVFRMSVCVCQCCKTACLRCCYTNLTPDPAHLRTFLRPVYPSSLCYPLHSTSLCQLDPFRATPQCGGPSDTDLHRR